MLVSIAFLSIPLTKNCPAQTGVGYFTPCSNILQAKTEPSTEPSYVLDMVTAK
ncbi:MULTISPECIES: hypothetical protein [unclassified Nostoc]|uniref:hypothetical protein n=1 Tax=unclassified Nostoc TaxID=2593658 RepID=UPI002AD310C1|nr:hypothetical protein [Nostoc sp. ChiQUE02]MDZ8229580.1 hypothetical protein [Nostoc sp. ChiQUE02]